MTGYRAINFLPPRHFDRSNVDGGQGGSGTPVWKLRDGGCLDLVVERAGPFALGFVSEDILWLLPSYCL